MVERKLHKTKLCVLNQKGRCSRQTCSFAHGDSELRRSFGSYNALKIKKFVKAHNRYSRIQGDLKRSQARLQKLGYQLGSYTSGAAGNVENLSVDIVSDGETTNYHLLGPQTEMQTTSSPNKKKLHAGQDSADVTIPEARGGRHQAESRQVEKKPSQWNVQPAQSNVDTEVEVTNNGVPKGGKNISAGFSFADKSKVLRSGSLLPSTGIAGIAAHVIEQEVEIEVEKFEEVEMDSSRVKKGAINTAPRNEDAI